MKTRGRILFLGLAIAAGGNGACQREPEVVPTTQSTTRPATARSVLRDGRGPVVLEIGGRLFSFGPPHARLMSEGGRTILRFWSDGAAGLDQSFDLKIPVNAEQFEELFDTVQTLSETLRDRQESPFAIFLDAGATRIQPMEVQVNVSRANGAVGIGLQGTFLVFSEAGADESREIEVFGEFEAMLDDSNIEQ